MNLKTAKEKAIQLINEYSNNGSLISAAQNADYLNRMNNLADTAQKEIATVRKIHAVYNISQNPILNQLGLTKGFDIEQHLDTDHTTTVATGSKSYYFEVDRQATIYIEEQISGVWTVLQTISVPSSVREFTAYKGLITPSSSTNAVRIRFSGTYPYNIRYRALYAYTFPSASDVPDYRPYIRYTMPADFMELKKVSHETDPRQYVSLTDYKWEGKKTFVVNYYHKGGFIIEYYRLPTTITSSTDENTYEFEVDVEAQELIPYYLGAHVIMDENQGIGTLLLNLYQSKLANLGGGNTGSGNTVTNLMGW